VRKNYVNKVSRMTAKGLDPNFIDADIGGKLSALQTNILNFKYKQQSTLHSNTDNT